MIFRFCIFLEKVTKCNFKMFGPKPVSILSEVAVANAHKACVYLCLFAQQKHSAVFL